MKRFGCHVLVLPNGEVLRMQVVELSDDGSVVNYYTLMEEQAATEWVGGVCILMPESIVPLKEANVKSLLLCEFNSVQDGNYRLWKAIGLSSDTIFTANPERWQLL